jgi:hypothetical protein
MIDPRTKNKAGVIAAKSAAKYEADSSIEYAVHSDHAGGTSDRVSAASTVLAAHRSFRFPDKKWNGDKSSNGVYPLNVEESVRGQPEQSYRSEVRAGGGLNRVGRQGGISCRLSQGALPPGQERHYD